MVALLLLSLFPIQMSGSSLPPIEITDTDNDGFVDEHDLIVDGNAVVVLSVEEFSVNGSFDLGFVLGLDRNGNGVIEFDETLENERTSLENISSSDTTGFGHGEVWYGTDVRENTTSMMFSVSLFNGSSSRGEQFDLDPENGSLSFKGELFLWNGPQRVTLREYSSTGAGDNDTAFGDAWVNVSLRVIRGTTIVSATPAPTLYLTELDSVSLKEGDSLRFSIDEVYIPEEINRTVKYEWYIGVFENLTMPPIEYYCVQNSTINATKDPASFEVHANFGSEGLYGLYCMALSDLEEEMGLYWYDMKAWGIRILHHNTVPQPRIDVTPEERITQLDSVSISGWRSFDRDGDRLNYTWYIDGVEVSTELEFEHTFVNGGVHSIRLEAEDDEGAVGVAVKNITVNNIPTPLDAVQEHMILGNVSSTVPFSYNRTLVDRRSVSTQVDLPFGYGFWVYLSLVSEVNFHHEGETDIVFRDLGTNYTYDITTRTTRISAGFRPYFDIELAFFEDGKRKDMINGSIPVPLQNNDLGLDSDDQPLVKIPTLTRGLVDVYTWDEPRVLLDRSGDSIDNLSVSVEDVDMLEVDLFTFVASALGIVIDQFAFLIGEAFNLLDVFANLHTVCRFDVQVDVEQFQYLLIDHLSSDFNSIELYDPEEDSMPGGSHDDRDIYFMYSSMVDVGIAPSLSLKFRLTEWGKSVYGTYDVFEKSGLIVGFVRSVYSIFTKKSPPKKEYDFDVELWQGGTLIEMRGDVREVSHVYWTYSSDIDRDGYINTKDAFPLDAAAWLDTDGDGMPDELNGNSTTGLVEDEDDDNDGVPDDIDRYPKDPERDGIEEDEEENDTTLVIIVVVIGALVLLALMFLVIFINRENEESGEPRDLEE